MDFAWWYYVVLEPLRYLAAIHPAVMAQIEDRSNHALKLFADWLWSALRFEYDAYLGRWPWAKPLPVVPGHFP
jgi:hypothetical protein